MSDNSLNVSRGGRSNWLLFNKVLLKGCAVKSNGRPWAQFPWVHFTSLSAQHLLLQTCQLSGNSSEREGDLVQMKPHHCNNNPESTSCERESVKPSTQKRTMDGKARADMWHFSHEIHTLLHRTLWLVVYEWSTEMVDREPQVLLNEQYKNR